MTKQSILLSFRTVFPFTIVSDNLADAHNLAWIGMCLSLVLN